VLRAVTTSVEVDDLDSPRWYRSLYWRATMAFFALFALLLASEAALFLWFSAGTAGAMPSDPYQMARLVAGDVGEALEADSKLDLRQHMHDQYGHYFQTILVAMPGGLVAANHDNVDAQVLNDARESVAVFMRPPRRFGGRGPGSFGRGLPPSGPSGGRGSLTPDGREGGVPPFGVRPPPPRGDRESTPPRGGGPEGTPPRTGREGNPPPFGVRPPPPRGERGRDPGGGGLSDRMRRRLTTAFEPVTANNVTLGVVVIPSGGPPFSRILQVVGPTVGLVAGGVLIAGGALIAAVVFGPARRRLHGVQQAAEQLGAGDLRARAPEQGGDEIAALASSFNHMADELTVRAHALESSDRARRQLLADVSHELMTPLTAMRGYIETLGMTELQLDPPTRERYMRIVGEETNRLESIIGDLLDLARLEGGGSNLRRESVPVDMLFNRVAERHERELAARRIRLDRAIAEDADCVTGDADRLEQAVQNLVANALRYTPEGGHIRLTSTRRDERSVITVQDSGPGIAEDQLELVFDRFYKGDASRQSAAGSGLGLSIVKAIVERHDGMITVRNDNGAVFEISLP